MNDATTHADSPVAIRLADVDKTYRLYRDQREAVADRLGLYAWAFWRERPEFREFNALKSVNITVRRGERVGVIGRNGAGKTTLLKLVTRNFEATTGKVEVKGTVQAIMQAGLGFHPDFTGQDNMRASLLYNGLAGKQLTEAMEDIAQFVELGEFINQPVFTYSAGMLARLQFAVATAVHPDVLIIDEIMGAGDAYFSVKSSDRMLKLANEGSTLMLVSHSTGQVLQFCERTIWLHQGRVMADGRSADVAAEYENFIKNEVADKGVETTVAPKSIDLEAYSKRTFLRDAILTSEPIELENEDELDEVLGGHLVHRWPGNKGIKISRVEWRQGPGPLAIARIGDDISLDLTLSCERSGPYELVYSMLFYGMDGRRLARIDSARDSTRLERGESRNVAMTLAPVIFAPGEYMISVGVFDATGSERAELVPKRRHDFLSRSYSLKILETNDSDAPVVNPPCAWHLGPSEAPAVPKITGWI